MLVVQSVPRGLDGVFAPGEGSLGDIHPQGTGLQPIKTRQRLKSPIRGSAFAKKRQGRGTAPARSKG